MQINLLDETRKSDRPSAVRYANQDYTPTIRKLHEE
jgi:hypothetical protein